MSSLDTQIDYHYERVQQDRYALFRAMIDTVGHPAMERSEYIANIGYGGSLDFPALQAFAGAAFSIKPVDPIPVVGLEISRIFESPVESAYQEHYPQCIDIRIGDAALVLPALVEQKGKPAVVVARNPDVRFVPMPELPIAGQGWRPIFKAVHEALPEDGHFFITLKEIGEMKTAEKLLRAAGFNEIIELQRQETLGFKRVLLHAAHWFSAFTGGAFGSFVISDQFILTAKKSRTPVPMSKILLKFS